MANTLPLPILRSPDHALLCLFATLIFTEGIGDKTKEFMHSNLHSWLISKALQSSQLSFHSSFSQLKLRKHCHNLHLDLLRLVLVFHYKNIDI